MANSFAQTSTEDEGATERLSVSLPEDENQGPVTYDDLGVPRPKREVASKFGKRRTIFTLSRWERAFGLVSLLAILGAAGLTIERLVSLNHYDADFTFALVVLLTTVFCLTYVINGIIRERPFELVILAIGTFILMVYSLVNFVQTVTMGEKYTIKLIRLVLVLVFGSVIIIAASFYARVYHKSKNFIFRIVGANVSLQKICEWFFFTESLFKFDLQLQLTLVVLILRKGALQITALEIVVLVIGTIFAVIWCIIGFVSIARNSKVLVYFLLATAWCEPAYIVYSFVRIATEWNTGDDVELIQPAILVAGVLGLLTRAALCLALVRSSRDFGKGLNIKVYGSINTAQCQRTDREEDAAAKPAATEETTKE